MAISLLAAAATDGRDLGACGDGRDIGSIVASNETGAAVGSGFGRGVVVYRRELSQPDGETVSISYPGDVLADPSGTRFAVLDSGGAQVFAFSGFERLAKTSIKALKKQSVQVWHWIPDSDEVVFFSSLVEGDIFGISETRTPHLVRANIMTGAGTALPLSISADYLSAAFDARGERVAIGFKDGHVEVRATSGGALLASYTGHDEPAWNSMGLAFHSTQELLASSDGNRLLYFDLEKRQVRSVHRTETGAKLLEFVADDRFLIAGDTSQLALLDRDGKILEVSRPEESYHSFYVADRLRKVFAVRGDFVCWRTFESWEATPVVARGAATAGGPPAAEDVTYKGVPLSAYLRQLRATDVKAQLDALYTIERIGPVAAAAVPQLLRFLTAPDWYVRTAAMTTLGAIGPDAKAAVPLLRAAENDTNESVRKAANAALERIEKSR